MLRWMSFVSCKIFLVFKLVKYFTALFSLPFSNLGMVFGDPGGGSPCGGQR